MLLLRMRTYRHTLRSRFIVKAMCATVVHMMKDASRFAVPSGRNDFNADRHGSLTLSAANKLREVNVVGNTRLFRRDPSNKFAHCSPPDAPRQCWLRTCPIV